MYLKSFYFIEYVADHWYSLDLCVFTVISYKCNLIYKNK